MSVTVKDKVWRDLVKRLKSKSYVKVGVLAAKGGNAQHLGDGITISELAAIHELGLGVPRRSFIKDGIEKNERKLQPVVAKLAKKVIEGMPLDQALGILGVVGADTIKNYVKLGAHVPPPLSDKTVNAKGSTRPLVDKGPLINSVTYEVVKR